MFLSWYFKNIHVDVVIEYFSMEFIKESYVKECLFALVFSIEYNTNYDIYLMTVSLFSARYKNIVTYWILS